MKRVKTRFKVNGKTVELELEPRRLLVSVLRDDLGLTGTHHGCDTTNCGACTVLMDGKAVKSCTVLGVQADGKEILTIEGLAGKDQLHPIQQAFIEKQGLQCGFSTPGMIMTSCWMLSQNKELGDEEIKRMLHGNICRCTGYHGIVESIKYAHKIMKKQEANKQ
ncbi:MAG TPA: (2Fe-2S)-binding protein [Candidatus Bathyarchaeia archaeon]|nr:(2Fe-2S)-binding protein [Candidatus Bathyarchaeia archaeon]